MRITTIVRVGPPAPSARQRAASAPAPAPTTSVVRQEARGRGRLDEVGRRGAGGGDHSVGAGRREAKPWPRPPGSLWLGAAVLGAAALAWAGTDLSSMGEGERMATLATFAGLGGAGSGLAVWGFWRWVRERSGRG